MDADHIIKALGALAQSTRFDVFRRLVSAGHHGMSAGAIAEELNVVASTLSHHLGLLESAGLVRSSRQGRHVIYSHDPDASRALITFLTDQCSPNDVPATALNGKVAISAAAE